MIIGCSCYGSGLSGDLETFGGFLLDIMSWVDLWYVKDKYK